jgi:hypothetical protein
MISRVAKVCTKATDGPSRKYVVVARRYSVFRMGGKRDSTAFGDKKNKSVKRDLGGRLVDGRVSELASRLNMWMRVRART